jgi:hypothetical protein
MSTEYPSSPLAIEALRVEGGEVFEVDNRASIFVNRRK